MLLCGDLRRFMSLAQFAKLPDPKWLADQILLANSFACRRWSVADARIGRLAVFYGLTAVTVRR